MITAVAVLCPGLDQTEISKCGWSTKEIFTKPGDVNDFPHLARICKTVAPEKWHRSGKRYTAEEVIRSAVERLPDDDRPDENPDYAAVTWREVGMTLGGFRDDLPPRDNDREYVYKALIAVLKSESKIEPKKWDYWGEGKLVGSFYGHLADALLELEKQAAEGEAEVPKADGAEPVIEEDETPDKPSDQDRSRSTHSNVSYGLINIVSQG
ncbi:hypothetical protein [Nocardiopsis rhodophaea]|uniref:hypothetical protein n=1 Tax=Nocardiopsis rhodophaea TaxID=280238 RepID=UPI0031DAD9F3